MYPNMRADNFEMVQIWLFPLQMLKRYDAINTGTTILEIGNIFKDLKPKRLKKLHGREN